MEIRPEDIKKTGKTLHFGIMGVGFRGVPQLELLLEMPDVNICNIYDPYEDRCAHAADLVEKSGRKRPYLAKSEDDFFAQSGMDAVIIMTSWQTHIPLAVKAMKKGLPVGLEVGGASNLNECFRLVDVSEETGVPVMLLENCCYGNSELALLNMVRQGLFGELVHVRGAYAHDLRDEIGTGDIKRHYRQENFLHRNGELYPTHELGPIAKYLNLNRGNRMVSLSAMASKAVGMEHWLKENRPNDPIAKYRFNQGDVVTTQIKCLNGETILLTHDCTLPRPYSRGGQIQGSKGIWMEDNRSIYIDGISPGDPSHWTHVWESDKKYMEEYKSPLWKAFESSGVKGGHGGMDFLVLRAFIDALQTKQPFPIDVYDTATWMAITVLSENSVAMGGLPVAVPDFTNGKYIRREKGYEGIYALD